MVGLLPNRKTTMDPGLLYPALGLLAIGILMVFSSSYAKSLDIDRIGNDGFHYLKRQALFAGVGVVAMVVMAHIQYRSLRRYADWIMAVSLFLLVLVYFIGISEGGATRWIGYGPVRIQPSEIAKVALVLYLAALVTSKGYPIRDLAGGFLAPITAVALTFVLIEREPDLGTAAVIGLSGLAMLFLAGARCSHLLAVCALGGLFVTVAVLGHGYRGDRVRIFFNPHLDPLGDGYQIIHGVNAVGSGRLTGLGIGAGREKYYLPAANTDFVFATLAEETGLWGSLVLIGLLLVLGYRAFRIANHCEDDFGTLLAAGLAAVILLQAAMNIAVVTASVPATGVPLPFVSYGGTSLVMTMASVGILLSITRHAPLAASGSGKRRAR